MTRLTNMERIKLMDELAEIKDYTSSRASELEYLLYGGGEDYTPGHYLHQKDPSVVVAAKKQVLSDINSEYGLTDSNNPNEWHEKVCSAIQEKWDKLTEKDPEDVKKALEFLVYNGTEGYYPGVKLAERFK